MINAQLTKKLITVLPIVALLLIGCSKPTPTAPNPTEPGPTGTPALMPGPTTPPAQLVDAAAFAKKYQPLIDDFVAKFPQDRVTPKISKPYFDRWPGGGCRAVIGVSKLDISTVDGPDVQAIMKSHGLKTSIAYISGQQKLFGENDEVGVIVSTGGLDILVPAQANQCG